MSESLTDTEKEVFLILRGWSKQPDGWYTPPFQFDQFVPPNRRYKRDSLFGNLLGTEYVNGPWSLEEAYKKVCDPE